MKELVFRVLQYLNPDRKFIFNITFLLAAAISLYGCHRNLDDPVSVETKVSYAVSGLKVVSAKDGIVMLSWQAIDAPKIYYNVYYSVTQNKNDLKRLMRTNTSNISVGHLEYDKMYYFSITAIVDSIESGYSDIVNAMPVNLDPPSTPAGLFVYGVNNKGEKSIQVSWNNSPDADFSSYQVFRASNSENSEYVKIAEMVSNLYVDNMAVENYKKYYYKVAAVDKGGLISAFTSPKYDYVIDTVALISPKDGEKVYDKIVLKWKAVDSAAGYHITLCNSITNTGFWMKDIPSTGAKEYEYIYDGNPITFKQYYYWKVSAYKDSRSNLNSFSKTNSFYFVRTGEE